MSRLIRMDGTGHSTLAEWTAQGRRGVCRRGHGVRRAAGPRLHQDRARRSRQGDPRARAAPRRGPRDHAPADRRRVREAGWAAWPPNRLSPSWPPFRGGSAPTRAGSLAGRIWHAWTLLYTVPFIAAGAGMLWLEPLAAPVALAALAHAWIIRAVCLPRRQRGARQGSRNERAEPVAQGLLGDLLGHEERELQSGTGLALERGELGVWLVGEGRTGVPRRAPRARVLRAHRGRPSSERSRGASAAGASGGRGGLCHCGQSCLRGCALAGAPAHAGGDATCARRGPPDRPLASTRAHLPPRSRGRPARRLRVGRVRVGCLAPLARAARPRRGSGAEELGADWERSRAFFEFLAAQPNGSFWIGEDGDEIVAYTRMARFGAMDELTELWVEPSHAGQGMGAPCSSGSGPSRRRPIWAAWWSRSARRWTSRSTPISA